MSYYMYYLTHTCIYFDIHTCTLFSMHVYGLTPLLRRYQLLALPNFYYYDRKKFKRNKPKYGQTLIFNTFMMLTSFSMYFIIF
jgi:hypothetical protein